MKSLILLLALVCVIIPMDAVHPPRYMISSLHGIRMKTKTESELLKEGECIACCKEIQEVKNASGTHFCVTKMSVNEFAKEINDFVQQKGTNSSVMFYIPDKDSSIKDVFRHCSKLENSLGPDGNKTVVVPCIYTTPWDAAHFTSVQYDNKIADSYYPEPSKATLKRTVSRLAHTIHAPISVFAHGFGARLLSRFDELKMDVNSKRPLFSHLFLAAPELETGFFCKADTDTNKGKGKGKDTYKDKGASAGTTTNLVGPNPSAGAAVAKAFKKVCVLFDPADHVLRDSAAETSIETDRPAPHFLGTEGLPADSKQLCEQGGKFDQLNCYPASIFTDPWKRHNYFQSEYVLGWINSQLGYYPPGEASLSSRRQMFYDMALEGM